MRNVSKHVQNLKNWLISLVPNLHYISICSFASHCLNPLHFAKSGCLCINLVGCCEGGSVHASSEMRFKSPSARKANQTSMNPNLLIRPVSTITLFEAKSICNSTTVVLYTEIDLSCLLLWLWSHVLQGKCFTLMEDMIRIFKDRPDFTEFLYAWWLYKCTPHICLHSPSWSSPRPASAPRPGPWAAGECPCTPVSPSKSREQEKR